MAEEKEIDVFQMYIEELEKVDPCTPEEEEKLLTDLAEGKKDASRRLVEGKLKDALKIAAEYRDRGLPMNDLVQEASMALLLTANEYTGGDFKGQMERRIREAVEEALKLQDTEDKIEEEVTARVNVLKDISASMAKELGREATVEELAERMKLSTDEISDIMKITLDAMSVVGN
ncbi:MAG: sigma-70 domain-containing protein [Clostridium sp.]|nr:sigma-70 domain-containing protein [Clostridium sp.]